MSTEYTYAAAFVKSIETNMITYREFESAIEEDLEVLENLMRQRDYDGKNIGQMLKNERIKLHSLCIDLTQNENTRDLLMLESDFHNIKAVIKSILSQKDFEDLIYEPTRIDCDALKEAVRSGDFAMLDETVSDICLDAFAIYKKEGIQAMEMFLDKKLLLQTISKSDGFVRGWAERKALWQDLKIYLRASGVTKRFLENALAENSLIDVFTLVNSDRSKEEVLSDLGYQKEYNMYLKSPVRFEKYCDDALTEYLQNAKTAFFDFDAILGYFEGKKTEMKNIRLVATAKKSGMKTEEVKERLRKTYV